MLQQTAQTDDQIFGEQEAHKTIVVEHLCVGGLSGLRGLGL